MLKLSVGPPNIQLTMVGIPKWGQQHGVNVPSRLTATFRYSNFQFLIEIIFLYKRCECKCIYLLKEYFFCFDRDFLQEIWRTSPYEPSSTEKKLGKDVKHLIKNWKLTYMLRQNSMAHWHRIRSHGPNISYKNRPICILCHLTSLNTIE